MILYGKFNRSNLNLYNENAFGENKISTSLSIPLIAVQKSN